MDWVYYTALIALLITGLFVNLLGLPGLWLMLVSAVAYAWWTDWIFMGWQSLTVLLVLAIIAEVVDNLRLEPGARLLDLGDLFHTTLMPAAGERGLEPHFQNCLRH